MKYTLLEEKFPKQETEADLISDEVKPEKETYDPLNIGKYFNPVKEKVQKTVKDTIQPVVSTSESLVNTLQGIPGDIFAITNLAARPLASKLTGKEGVEYEKTPLSKVFPTSSQLKERSEKITPFSKPRNNFQKWVNDTVDTTALILTPGGQARVGITRLSPPVRALYKSIGSSLVSKIPEGIGGTNKDTNYVKAGTLFLMNMLDRRGVGGYITNLYRTADQALETAGNPTTNTTQLMNELTNIRNRLMRGNQAPSEQTILNQINPILERLNANPEMPVENLVAISRSLNEVRQDIFRNIGREGGLRARRLIDPVIRSVNQAIHRYGRTNPNFSIPYQEAQDAFGTIAQSNLVTRTLNNLTGLNIKNPTLLHLLTGGAVGAGAAVGGVPAIAGAGVYQLYKLMYRIMNSPALARYYGNVIRSASSGSVAQTAKEVKALDKKISKSKEKEEYHLIRSK